MIEADRWLQLGVLATEADPTDHWLVQISLAGSYGMRGRFDLARPLFTAALPRVQAGAFDVNRHDDVVDQLASVALVAALFRELDILAALHGAVALIARTSPTDGLELVCDVLGCLVELATTPPATSWARAERIFEAATGSGTLLAAWHACIIQTTLARLTHDGARGLVWYDRMNVVQQQMGAQPGVMPMEGRAGALADVGRAELAVQLYSAAKALARHTGLAWPVIPTTPDRLTALREELGNSAFEAAWTVGAAMSPDAALAVCQTETDTPG